MGDDALQFTESRPGGTRDAANYISCKITERLYVATAKALPWELVGQADPEYAKIPSRYIERLFKLARCTRPAALDESDMRTLTRCLDEAWLKGAVNLLLDEGLTSQEGDNAEEGPKDRLFESKEELYKHADELVLQLIDEAALQVDEKAWEWLHPEKRSVT